MNGVIVKCRPIRFVQGTKWGCE